MRFLVAAGALVAVLAASGSVAAASSTPTGASQTQLTATVCHRAFEPGARRVGLTAVMRPVSGTAGLAMMFDLERSAKRAGPFTIVRGRGLDTWVHPSNATLGQRPGDIWRVNQKVSNLPGPAYYRFRVAFRWIGSKHTQLATVTEFGAVCFQPELRPDLLVRSITVKPVLGNPSEDRYIAQIGNRGRTGAGPFQLELELPSAAPQLSSVTWLGPRASARDDVIGPVCTPGSSVTMVVDPSGAIEDSDRANNTLTITCPSPAQN